MSTFVRIHNSSFYVRNFNDDFVLLNNQDITGLAPIGKAILDQNFKFIDEVIATEKEIYLKLNHHYQNGNLGQLSSLTLPKTPRKRIIKIPVCFDVLGDWKSISTFTGFDKEKYLEELTALDLSIAMFGFLPGFVYMNGLKNALHVPRKKVPTRHIPANSLAVGGPYLGIYSLPSPGGWSVLGQLPFSILNWNKLPPVALDANDTIQLQAIDQQSFDNLKKRDISLITYNGLT